MTFCSFTANKNYALKYALENVCLNEFEIKSYELKLKFVFVGIGILLLEYQY